ncbi:hypothetical protein ARAM_007789, partial [Aspergillus rambellii]
RESLIAQLSRLLDSEATLSSSALKQSYVSRHREVLQEHKRELQRLTAAISESRDRANLLSTSAPISMPIARRTPPLPRRITCLKSEAGLIGAIV